MTGPLNYFVIVVLLFGFALASGDDLDDENVSPTVLAGR
jgi:hypothetical protein